MIQTSPTLTEKLKSAKIFFLVPEKWQSGNLWISSPRDVVAKTESNPQGLLIMSCYFSVTDEVFFVSTLRPSGSFKENTNVDKMILDAYMPMVLKGLITQAKIENGLIKKIILQSMEMPYIYDHIIDAGFFLKKQPNSTMEMIYEF
jgi:hypothetical protein